MPTQNDIANAAGLSRMTVYRYLSGKKVSQKSKSIIKQVLNEMGYRPNLIARSLVFKRTNLIGLLVPSVSYSFYPDIIQSIQKTIRAAGYNLLLTVSNEDPVQEREEIELLLSMSVDGIIVIPTSSEDSAANCASLAEENTPFVMVDRFIERVKASYVVTDSYTASKQLVQHLIDIGHTRITHIGGPHANSFAGGVRNGFIAAMEENHIDIDENLLFSGRMEGEDVPDIFEKILDFDELPTAVQAVNDVCALAVISEARKNGIDIPKDLTVVGFSDIRTAHLLDVPLTTIREDAHLLGLEASRILIETMMGKRKRRVARQLPGELIVRKSSAPPPKKTTQMPGRGEDIMDRRAYLMRLKREHIGDYVLAHKKENIWKGVVDCLVKSGTTRMVIFQHGQDIILFEEAQDLENSYKEQSKDAETARWDAMISQWMEEYPHFDEIKGDLEYEEIPIVFYLDHGALLHD